MKQEFYSHGKLLLTGEYVVLDGAKALALPCKQGQKLHVEVIKHLAPTDRATLAWKSYDQKNHLWYETTFLLPLHQASNTENQKNLQDKTLLEILLAAQALNPDFLQEGISLKSYIVTTFLEFDRSWGLGSSSTIIYNIAKWAKVNPFLLLEHSFGGSGYDIAAAGATGAITYQRNLKNIGLPNITNHSEFCPKFKDALFFVHLNIKKNSKEAITSYRSLDKTDLDKIILKINQITNHLLTCPSLTEFEKLLHTHEDLLSNLLQVPTIKQQLFPDFNHGIIKSLGGWGGDFILATGKEKAKNYFRNKGYTTILNYEQVILGNP